VSVLAGNWFLHVADNAQGDNLTAHITRELPALPSAYTAEAPRAIEDSEKEFSAFTTLRQARADKRNLGQKQKREDAKKAEEAAKK
jgi:large subunit ribosomal protein L13e